MKKLIQFTTSYRNEGRSNGLIKRFCNNRQLLVPPLSSLWYPLLFPLASSSQVRFFRDLLLATWVVSQYYPVAENRLISLFFLQKNTGFLKNECDYCLIKVTHYKLMNDKMQLRQLPFLPIEQQKAWRIHLHTYELFSLTIEKS